MCITSSEVKADRESYILAILCEKCSKEVEGYLKDKEGTLFDYDIKEYGFCENCLKAIDEYFIELTE